MFEAAADTIASYEADERTMTQYIIGAVSDMDVPMTPATKGLFGLNAYMTGLDDAWIQKEREEVLTATAEAEALPAFGKEASPCRLGTELRACSRVYAGRPVVRSGQCGAFEAG